MHNNINVNVSGPVSAPATYKTVILKPNMVDGVNLLTQEMMNTVNTKYVIKHDFVLTKDVVEDSVNVLSTNISQCVNPAYANALAAYNEAHDAWIDADNAYTNDPNETTLAAKNAAYAVYNAAQTTLNNTPQYYFYASKSISIKKHNHIELGEGAVLLNSTLNGTVEFDVASSDMTVYIGSIVPATYSYTVKNAIVMPAGCLIEFDGGSVDKGVIYGNDTVLIYRSNLEDVTKDTELRGTWYYNNFQLDKLDNTNGMGRIYLKPNQDFSDQLTLKNTIYIIQHEYDLKGESVTIPENCVLEFDGGSLDNGTLVFNKTKVITNGIGKPWDNTVKITGDFYNSPERNYSTGELGIPYTNSKINRRITANPYFYTLTYHRRASDNNAGRKDLLLYLSEDGYSFYNAYKINLCDNPNKSYCGDYSFVFHKGTYYIIADYGDNTKPYYNSSLGGYNCVCLYKSKDLLNFICVEIEIPEELRANFRQAWAPDIFVYNDELYFTVTSTDGANVFTVPNSETQRWVHNIAYICKIDEEHNTISDYTTFVLPDNSTTEIPYTNWIDGHIFNYSNNWYLLIKDENERVCYLYGIPDFTTYMDVMSPSNPIPLSSDSIHKFNFVGEGPSVAIKGSQLYFYFDLYTTSTSEQDLERRNTVAVVISRNLETFTNPTYLYIEEDCWNRHSTYKYCPSSASAERNIIENAIFLNGNVNNVTLREVENSVRLVNLLREDVFLPSPNTSYYIFGNDQAVIKEIDTRFFKAGDRFLVYFNTNVDSSSLSIEQTDNIRFLPNGLFFSGSIYKESVIEFIYTGSYFRTAKVFPYEKQELCDVMNNITTPLIDNVYKYRKFYNLKNFIIKENDGVYVCVSTAYTKSALIAVTFYDADNNILTSSDFNGPKSLINRWFVPANAEKMLVEVRSNAYSTTDEVTFKSICVSTKLSKEMLFRYMYMMAFGDSITAGVSENNNTSWVSFITTLYNNERFINNAVGGSSWTSIQGRDCILTSLKGFNTDSVSRAQIYLSGGINDVNNGATIGDVSSVFDYATLNTSTYTDTVIGSIECAFAYIFQNMVNLNHGKLETNNINPKIIYVLTYPHTNIPSWGECREKIKAVCAKWGVVCIDMAEIVGLGILDSSILKPAYLFCDNMHPSEYANRLICDFVVNKVYENSI